MVSGEFALEAKPKTLTPERVVRDLVTVGKARLPGREMAIPPPPGQYL
jgi:hypothetical protein